MRRFVVLALIMTAACSADPQVAPRELVERSHVAMGSSLTVSIWTPDVATAAAGAERVFQEFDRLDALLSVWKDGSDVVRINQAAGIEPVGVSRETLEVLRAALDASAMTDGKFDVTFGALSDIWRFDHDQDNRVPTRASIAARLRLVDWRALDVNPLARTAFLTRRGMRVHLGGIGKGYAVDRGVTILRDQGFVDFLIQAGGDMYAAGTNNGTPWKLGIADPRGSHQPFAAVEVRDATLSTSGDYERSFMKDGVRYHHLIDPDTGLPARRSRSVTIIANSAMLADVLSTGVFIMGADAGMPLIEKLNDVEGIIVTDKNEVLISSGLTGRVQFKGAPTAAP
jgi:thiamine biosynthesis lipoprotein